MKNVDKENIKTQEIKGEGQNLNNSETKEKTTTCFFSPWKARLSASWYIHTAKNKGSSGKGNSWVC